MNLKEVIEQLMPITKAIEDHPSAPDAARSYSRAVNSGEVSQFFKDYPTKTDTLEANIYYSQCLYILSNLQRVRNLQLRELRRDLQACNDEFRRLAHTTA